MVVEPKPMASSSSIISSPLLLPSRAPINHRNQQLSLFNNRNATNFKNRVSFRVLAAKLPAGVCSSCFLLLIFLVKLYSILPEDMGFENFR